MATLSCLAQAVTVNFDEKVIWADSLNMPESTVAEYIVNILPELLERPGDNFLNDYTVKVEDTPVGSAVYSVLTQIRFCDIEKITVSESPLSSFQNDSKSGSVNITLKKRATKEKPYWGSVSTDITSPTNICPKLSFGYKEDKFMFRAIVLGEYDNASHDYTSESYDDNGKNISSLKGTNKNKGWVNMTSLFMNYKPSAKDDLSLNVSFRHGDDKIDNIAGGSISQTDSRKMKAKDLRAYFKFKHKLSGQNEFQLECQYNHQPSDQDQTSDNDFITTGKKTNEISGQLKFKFALFAPESKYKSFLSVGSNGSAAYSTTNTDHSSATDQHFSEDKSSSKSLTPFIESENTFGQFRLKLQANLQHYHYDFRHYGNERMEMNNNDISGKMMTEWHFRKGQTLRLIADHQIKRPSESLIYPYIVEDATTSQHVLGNKDLKNVTSDNFTLDYIYSNTWGYNSLTMNVSYSYNHIANIIESEIKTPDNDIAYQTYYNSGKNDMLVGMFMALYKYKKVSLTLTADYYNNFKKLDTGNDHFHYFNIVLMPTFRTESNWMGSMRIKYFSPVEAKNLHRGGCAGISCQLGKSWGDLNVHAYGSFSLAGKTTDTTYYDDGAYYQVTSDVIKNAVGIGVRYSF